MKIGYKTNIEKHTIAISLEFYWVKGLWSEGSSLLKKLEDAGIKKIYITKKLAELIKLDSLKGGK